MNKEEQRRQAAEEHWKMQYIMALDESTKPYIIQDFEAGAEWEAKNSFSKEDMIDFALFYYKHQGTGDEYLGKDLFQGWENERDYQPTKTDSTDND